MSNSFQSSWISDRLGKVQVEFVDGDRSAKYPKRSEFALDGIPFLNAESISNGRLDASKANFITREKYDTIKKGRLQSGDLILTTRGNGVGKPAFFDSPRPALINAQLLIIRPDPRHIIPKFLYYSFCDPDFQSQLRNFTSGSAQPQLPITSLREVEVRIAPISTQRKIASILSAYDDLIENNTRRIAILEAMAQAIYREWFVEFHFPGHEKVKLVDSPLGKIPAGWRWAKLKEVCDSINYGFTASANKEEIGPKFLRITDIVPSVIDWDKVPYCDIDPHDADKYSLKEGDIVIARTGATTGYAKRLNKRHQKSVFASYLVRIRPATYLGKHYAGLIVESDLYKEFIKRNLGGAAQPQANAQVLTSIDILVPANQVISAFDEAIQPLADNKELLQIKNRNLRTTRDLLLPKLISGQLDVEELDIETGETVTMME